MTNKVIAERFEDIFGSASLGEELSESLRQEASEDEATEEAPSPAGPEDESEPSSDDDEESGESGSGESGESAGEDEIEEGTIVRKQSKAAGQACWRNTVSNKVHYEHAKNVGKLACGREKVADVYEPISLWDCLSADAKVRCKDCFGFTVEAKAGKKCDGDSLFLCDLLPGGLKATEPEGPLE